MSTLSPQTDERTEPGEPLVRETRLWHAQAHMPTVKSREIVIARGEGAYVWDESGHRMLDAPAALWYCNVGHGRAEIADAAAAQMRKLAAYSSFQEYATRPALELAERLGAMVPVDNPKIFLTSGGGDAVDATAKLIRRYWSAIGRPEKSLLVTRSSSYHGLHGHGTSIVGIEIHKEGLPHLDPGTIRIPTNDAAALEALIAERGDEIAAVFCEPIVGSGGIIPPAPGYLERVQELCRANDIIFVADEVITGFGRAGAMFASERFGLRPDVMIMAKGMTSGYLPMGATVIGERVWAPFWEDGSDLVFRHGLTYSGHATVCAAAHANLDIIEREGLVDRVRRLETVLHDALQPLAAHPLVKEVRSGVGLLAAVELHDYATAQRVCGPITERGVLMRLITGPNLHISPPFVLDESDIALIASTIREVLDEVAAA
jgi:adenosylmethionine-8-amino-7-oxononanoate aminotransferase